MTNMKRTAALLLSLLLMVGTVLAAALNRSLGRTSLRAVMMYGAKG